MNGFSGLRPSCGNCFDIYPVKKGSREKSRPANKIFLRDQVFQVFLLGLEERNRGDDSRILYEILSVYKPLLVDHTYHRVRPILAGDESSHTCRNSGVDDGSLTIKCHDRKHANHSVLASEAICERFQTEIALDNVETLRESGGGITTGYDRNTENGLQQFRKDCSADITTRLKHIVSHKEL